MQCLAAQILLLQSYPDLATELFTDVEIYGYLHFSLHVKKNGMQITQWH